MSDDDPTDNDNPAREPQREPAKSYEVGYGKPPVHSRWRKNQSGNSSGRRRGAKGFKHDRDAMLKQPVSLSNGNTITTQQASLATLRAKALKGDQRALDRLLGLAAQAHDDAEAAQASGAQADLTEADQALIADFIARRAPKQTPGDE